MPSAQINGEPGYDELPVRAGAPAGSSWGVFGDDDERGTLNRVSAEGLRRASQEVIDGRVIALNWEIDKPSPAIFGRRSPIHHVHSDDVATEDYYDDFFPQASSQWDALCHVHHPDHGFYNGFDPASTPGRGGSRLGIQNWARTGIAGRFVLIDVERSRSRSATPLDCALPTAVGHAELDAILAEQGVEVRRGDILLVHFGWTSWYEQLDVPTRQLLLGRDDFASPGLAASEDMARWLWDRGFSAVATDTPAVESTPFDVTRSDGFLHYRLIALLGFALGEFFQLADLASYCGSVGRYSGLFTAAPMNMPGGAGSPANAVALM